MNLPIYLVVTGYFPTPHGWRGPFVYDQVVAIQRTGRYQVIVVNCKSKTDYHINGVEVYGVRRISRFYACFPQLFDIINFMFLTKTLRRHHITWKDVSVIHAHMITGAFYAYLGKKMNRRMVTLVQFHDPDPIGVRFGTGSGFLGVVKRTIIYLHHRYLIEHVDAAVAISENVARVARDFPRADVYREYSPLQEWQHELRRFRSPRIKKTILLHNGVDTSIFHPASTPTTTKNSNSFTIGCIGNFIDWKDQSTLIRAVALLTSDERHDFGQMGIDAINVVFIGSGPELESCKALAGRAMGASHGRLEIAFQREVWHDQLPDFYRGLDLFVLPSYFEGFGCVFTEAYSCGIPFVTCYGQGVGDLLADDEKDKWLCRPQDPEELAGRIRRFIVERPMQRLSAEIDIDKLIVPFLKETEGNGYAQ